MPIDETHAKELRGLIAAAKQAPVNFGLALGPKPDADTLLMHRTKAPKALSMEARTQAKATKVAMGSATVDGSTLSLVCEERPPSGLAKRTRALLKTMKLNFKVRLVGADGEVFEDDGEEVLEQDATEARGAAADAGVAAPARPPEPPASGPAAPRAEPAPPDAAALAKALAALAARIPAASGADEARRAALLKLATQANVYLKTNNPNYAASTIEQLRAQIEGGSPTPPAPPAKPPQAPDAAALAKQLAALIPRVAALPDPARKAELGKLAQMCNVYLKTNNWNTAASSIAELARALDGSSGEPPRARQAGVFEKAGREWLAARQGVEDEMERLRATIMATYEGQPRAAEIDKTYRERTAPVLRTLDASLAVKLSAAGKADAAAQQGVIDEASAIVRGYEAFAAGPLLADLDDNPFVPLSIQADLAKTLSQISAALR